jgi:hypothetical protein
MKLIITFASLLIILTSCGDTTEVGERESHCIPVKIVASMCEHAVLQVTDPAYYHLTEDGWKDDIDKKHDHVFYTNFNCATMAEFNKLAMPSLKGLTFDVEIVTTQEPGNCMTCLALFISPPTKKHLVEICPKGN